MYGKNIQLTEAIKTYIEDKIGIIEHFFEEPLSTNIHVNATVFKGKHCIEITLPLSNHIIRAEAQSDDLYKSVDIAEEKMKRQIRKYKTKVNRKQRKHYSEHTLTKKETETNARKINRVEPQRFAKPMNIEEAILQMKVFKLDHLFFIDDHTNELRAVYSLDHDHFGLITPNYTDVVNLQVG